MFKPNFYPIPSIITGLISVILSQSSRTSAFTYGQHFPNGKSAVDYIYGVNGTWKEFSPLNYNWNYYPQYATTDHPFDKGALITAANGSAFYTARDANGYLLCDSNHDFEIDISYCQNGSAFHEHNGMKAKGVRSGNPFTQFWLDDNWLARYMSETYNRPNPVELVEQDRFIRWRVIGQDTLHWSPHKQTYFDTLALDGLYYLTEGQVNSSIRQWDQSLKLSSATWNEVQKRYEYPGISENYHMGLWKILTEVLLDNAAVPENKRNLMLQHSVSLQKQIIMNQEIDQNGNLIGWISNIGSSSALINTESVSCGVLGLGASAKFIFEVTDESGYDKGHKGRGQIHRSEYTVFIETYGNSNLFGVEEKLVKRTTGPGFPLVQGKYVIVFVLRAKNPQGQNQIFGNVKVLDVNSKDSLGHRELTAGDFVIEGEWNRISLEVNVRDFNTYDFQIEWDEGKIESLEISAIIVK